jgi:hypothetical protein
MKKAAITTLKVSKEFNKIMNNQSHILILIAPFSWFVLSAKKANFGSEWLRLMVISLSHVRVSLSAKIH